MSPSVRDRSRYAIKLRPGDCTGTIIESNVDAGATVATLHVDNEKVAPKPRAITVRDVTKIDGPGRKHLNAK
jgi:hypothetical protein